MKIIGITIKDEILAVLLDTALTEVSDDTYLYIDTLNNYSNRNSIDVNKHAYIVPLTDEGVSISEDGYTIYIDITGFKPELVLTAFTVTFKESSQLYIDWELLYYKEVDLLCTSCSTCLDDLLKDRLVLFILKKDLLMQAIGNSLTDDAVKYYLDIARMLKINVDNNVINLGCYGCGCCSTSHNPRVTVCNSCCKNGVCALC